MPAIAEDFKAAVLARIDAEAARVVALSREIHSHPDVAFEEHGTVHRLLTFLRAHPAVDTEEHTGGLATAFRAWVGSNAGPAIGIICEYDAIPGMGHACGHNLIAASAVAVLATVKIEFHGRGAHVASRCAMAAGSTALSRGAACAQAAALATACTVSIERPRVSNYPPMKLNRTLGRALGDALRSLGGGC